MRISNQHGQTIIEALACCASLLGVVIFIMCGLYAIYLKSTLNNDAYEFLVCETAVQNEINCETQIKNNISQLLIVGHLKDFQAQKTRESLNIHFEIKWGKVELKIERSIALPLTLGSL